MAKQLVLGIFPDLETAERAVDNLQSGAADYMEMHVGSIGILVLDESGTDPRVYTEFDAELHRRACDQAPLVFAMFEMEWLFPDIQP